MSIWRDADYEWEVLTANTTARQTTQIQVHPLKRGQPDPAAKPTTIATFYRNDDGQSVVELTTTTPLPLNSFIKAIENATARG